MATRTLGLDDLVGSLQPGKRADVVRLGADRPGLADVRHLLPAAVYCAASCASSADVWVDGRAWSRLAR